MNEGAPLIVTVAPNGAYKTRDDHPALPISPAELARCAADCVEAGAAMIHLHVRDSEGRHSLDASAYQAAIDAIRAQVGRRILIQATSEAAKRYSAPEQIAAMRQVRADSVSIALREVAPHAEAEPAAAEFFAWLAAAGILPQYILYDEADLERYGELLERGLIPDRPHLLLFVLGRYSADQTSRPEDLMPFVAHYAGRAPWAVCAFGPQEHACAAAAATLGGHVRVGFENNLYLKDGTLAADNAALVAQLSETARLLGRPLADADAVREMMGIG